MTRPRFLFSAPCLLARWLRIFGFRAEVDPTRVQVASPEADSPHFKVWILNEDSPPATVASEVLLPAGDWKASFEVLAGAVGLTIHDLILHRVCPSCSGSLEAVAAGKRPRGAPRGLPGVFVCDQCQRRGWAYRAYETHRKTWQELFLGALFQCGRCHTQAPEARGRNRLEVRSQHQIGPVEIPAEDFETDPSAEIAAILKLLETRSAKSLEADVHVSFDLFLCNPCRRDFVRTIEAFRNSKPSSAPSESETP